MPDESPRRRYDAVLLDFCGPLARPEDPVRWVTGAAASCGRELARGPATGLADRLMTAGRPHGPTPARVPVHLAECWADRDLDPAAHRAAYTGLAALVECGIDGLPDALYARALDPAGWRPAAGAADRLAGWRRHGARLAVVANVGFDIRPHLAAWGLAEQLEAVVLSHEVGRAKPDPAIYLRALAALRADPERTLVVGGGPADAGAAALGCTALILPADGADLDTAGRLLGG